MGGVPLAFPSKQSSPSIARDETGLSQNRGASKLFPIIKDAIKRRLNYQHTPLGLPNN